MKDFIKKIWELSRPFKKALLTMLAFTVGSQIIQIISPFLYGRLLDALIKKQVVKDLLVILLITLIVYLLETLLNYLKERYELNNFDFKIGNYITGLTVKKFLEGYSIGQHTNENSGIKRSVIEKGEQAIKDLIRFSIYNYIPTALYIFLSIVALIFISWMVALLMLAIVAWYIILVFNINRRLGPELKQNEENWHQSSKLLGEIAQNIELVKTNAQEQRVGKEFLARRMSFSLFGRDIWLRYATGFVKLNVLTDVSRVAVVSLSAWGIFAGFFSPGYLLIILSLSNGIFGKLQPLNFWQRDASQNYAKAQKYFVMMNVPEEVKEIKNSLKPEKFQGVIEFKAVSFAYPFHSYLDAKGEVKEAKIQKTILDKVSFSIEAGQKVAIVGESGAGKSTIINMLFRAYDPDSGQILIDGQDLRLLGLKKYREAIGYVEQDVTMFDNTVKYNLLFGLNGKAKLTSDQEIWDALRIASLDNFVKDQKHGLDTIIGERGMRMSGGQKQRLGIARALIKKPSILIFDEATSSLDADNERMVHQAIDKISQHKTTIIIAHRLSTIKNVDKVVVLDKGQVVGQGSFNELMQSCEPFIRQVNLQLGNIII